MQYFNTQTPCKCNRQYHKIPPIKHVQYKLLWNPPLSIQNREMICTHWIGAWMIHRIQSVVFNQHTHIHVQCLPTIKSRWHKTLLATWKTQKTIYLTYDLPIQEFKYKEKKNYLQMQKVHFISKSDNKMLQTFHVGFLFTSGSLP